jgi:hypothetical protein
LSSAAAFAVALCIACAVAASAAKAGTYTISNCPAAGNSDAGSWSIFGSPQSAKGTCDGGEDAFIGPQGSNMSANGSAGVRITAPAGSGITISEATVWWQVAHQVSGADMFALAADNDGAVYESPTPMTGGLPSTWALPSPTTQLTLEAYCANDDAGAGCALGSGENSILKLYGAKLTLHDSAQPTGTITDGTLTGANSVSGAAAIGFQAGDASSGVLRVRLQVDGEAAAEKSYAASCSYTTFQACPANESDTIQWDSATLPDGQHQIDLVVEDAAQNTTVIYNGTIHTENAPTALSAPSISGTAEVGSTLTATPATFTAPRDAGALSAISGQWLRCNDAEGTHCATIDGASTYSYAPSASDIGYYLVYQNSVSDADGSTNSESAPTVAVIASASKETSSTGSQTGANNAGAAGGGGSSGSGSSSGSSDLSPLTVNLNNTTTTATRGANTPWKISLKVAPKKVRRHEKITLKGIVRTRPRPQDGKQVYLKARDVAVHWQRKHTHYKIVGYGKWIIFDAIRTSTAGVFSAVHKFRLGGKHVYQFIAVAPSEGGYRNTPGRSKIITVKEF